MRVPHKECNNCYQYRPLVPMRVKVTRFLSLFILYRKYHPEGEEGIYVCHECKDRIVNKKSDSLDFLDSMF